MEETLLDKRWSRKTGKKKEIRNKKNKRRCISWRERRSSLWITFPPLFFIPCFSYRVRVLSAGSSPAARRRQRQDILCRLHRTLCIREEEKLSERTSLAPNVIVAVCSFPREARASYYYYYYYSVINNWFIPFLFSSFETSGFPFFAACLRTVDNR